MSAIQNQSFLVFLFKLCLISTVFSFVFYVVIQLTLAQVLGNFNGSQITRAVLVAAEKRADMRCSPFVHAAGRSSYYRRQQYAYNNKQIQNEIRLILIHERQSQIDSHCFTDSR